MSISTIINQALLKCELNPLNEKSALDIDENIYVSLEGTLKSRSEKVQLYMQEVNPNTSIDMAYQLLQEFLTLEDLGNVFTFRTEDPCDNDRVPALLFVLRDTLGTEEIPNETQGYFSFKLPEKAPLDSVKESMQNIIETNKAFVDMHRCFQTLALGNVPNNKWFLYPPIDPELLESLMKGKK